MGVVAPNKKKKKKKKKQNILSEIHYVAVVFVAVTNRLYRKPV